MSASTHQLLYTATGDPANPLIILVHGWLSHRGIWRTTLPALQDRFYCVAVDLLGFADNPGPAGADYSIPAQARRILALADELGYEKFSLLGHSMGGQIVTHLAALTAPGRVERLVTVGGVVTGRLTPFVEYLIVPMIRMAAAYPPLVPFELFQTWPETHPWFANFMFQGWFYDMDFAPFDSWRIDRQMATQRSIVVSAARAYDSLRATDLTACLPEVRARTLVLSGEQDGTVPAAQARRLAECIPGARLVLFDQCGHMPMFERTEAYLAALNDFLAAA